MFNKIAAHLKRGQYGERIAAKYLKQQGLQIIANNVRTRYGEIDLIAQEQSTLVFIEVRTRSISAYAGAAESITAAKQQKWQRSAQSYLQTRYTSQTLPPCRFDAVCITINKDGQPDIEWLQHVIS